MLKLTLDNSGNLKIAENDRAQWNQEGAGIFNGFDGEAALYVIPMAMQGGTCDLVAVYSSVDAHNTVFHDSGKDLQELIDRALATLLTYHD